MTGTELKQLRLKKYKETQVRFYINRLEYKGISFGAMLEAKEDNPIPERTEKYIKLMLASKE